MGQAQNLTSKIRMGGWFEEECLLGQVKHGSNVYPKVQGNLPGSFSGRDVYLECTRGLGAQKYLRKCYCHRIKCSATNFLVALMWRRPLNCATLATPTHRGPEKVSDGTSTPIVAQMINKCRTKIVQRELYNVRDPPWRRDRRKRGETLQQSRNKTCNRT